MPLYLLLLGALIVATRALAAPAVAIREAAHGVEDSELEASRPHDPRCTIDRAWQAAGDPGLPDREPGSGEVAVAITHAGVNPIDRYNAEGKVAPDVGHSPDAGSRGGRILADGSVVLISGEGLGSVRDGVWATRAVVPATSITHVPAGVDPAVVACMGIAGLTAWSVVVLRADVQETDRVLILGAGGGVGLAAVSLARSRRATVWGQVGSAAKADAVSDAGAHHVIVGDETVLTNELRPTVIIDPLGAGFTEKALDILEPQGTYVVFGTSAGARVTLDWQQVYRRGLTIHGQGNLNFTTGDRQRHLTDALAAVACGDLRIPIDRLLPLEQVNDAFAALIDRTVVGKIVLTFD